MDPESERRQADGGFRKQVLGDNAFTKEELALKTIRDEANGDKGEESKIPNSYQRHLDKINNDAA